MARTSYALAGKGCDLSDEVIVVARWRTSIGIRLIQEDANESAARGRVLNFMYSYLRATVPGEHCRMHVGFCGFESGNRHLAIRFKQVRGFHVLVAQVAYGQHVFDAVRPGGEYVIGVVRVSARMKALLFLLTYPNLTPLVGELSPSSPLIVDAAAFMT